MNFFWIFLPSISTCSILFTILIFSAEKLVSNNSTKLSRAQLGFSWFFEVFRVFFRILKMNNILVFGFARTISILQKLSLKSNSIKKNLSEIIILGPKFVNWVRICLRSVFVNCRCRDRKILNSWPILPTF